MNKTLVSYGIIIGVILTALVIIPLKFLNQIQDFSFFEEVELIVMTLVSGLFIYLGLRKASQINPQNFNYSNRVLKGIIIVLISGITYGLVWNTFTYLSPKDPDREYLEKILEDMRLNGASEDDLQDAYYMADYIIDRPVLKIFVSMSEPLTNGIWLPFIIAFFFRNKIKGEDYEISVK